VLADLRYGEQLGITRARVVQFALVGSLRRYSSISATNLTGAVFEETRLGVVGRHVYRFDEIQTLVAGHAP